jgi:hypothetical protein
MESDKIIAKEIVLIDSNNNPRIEMSCIDDIPIISLRDTSGKTRVSLSVSSTNEGTIELVGQRNKAAAILAAVRGGGFALRFRDSLETDRLSIATDENGDPSISLRDINGTIRVILTLDENNSPILSLMPIDGSAAKGIAVAVKPDGTPYISGVNASGITTFEFV